MGVITDLQHATHRIGRHLESALAAVGVDQGEAHALKSRWSEAEGFYRQAIELMPDDRVRRSWYYNLADLALHLGDEPERLKALEAAKGTDSKDEITQRALELLRYTRSRSLPSVSQTANASNRNGFPDRFPRRPRPGFGRWGGLRGPVYRRTGVLSAFAAPANPPP